MRRVAWTASLVLGATCAAAWTGAAWARDAADGVTDGAIGHVTERVAGVELDYSTGAASVEGTGAADRRAPSADVARVKAERTARLVAARRLRAALAALPVDRLGCPGGVPTEETVAQATAEATPTRLEWGSDGSVRLTVRVPFQALVPRPGSGKPAAAAASDGHGAHLPAAILIEPAVRPALFQPGAGGGCDASPPVFRRLTEARALGGEYATAPVLPAPRATRTGRAATDPALGPDGGAHRIIAIVREHPEPHDAHGAHGGSPP